MTVALKGGAVDPEGAGGMAAVAAPVSSAATIKPRS